MVGKTVIIELKNGLRLKGTLQSADQYLNVKISEIEVDNNDKYPQLWAMKKVLIRGSAIRYIEVDPEDVDVQLLQDATRRAYRPQED